VNKNRKSIIVFLLLVLGITYVWEIGIYRAGISYGSAKYNAFMVGLMWFPAICVYAAKWICKEKIRFGLKSEINLLPSCSRKNGKYYILAVTVPFIYILAADFLIYLRYPEQFNFDKISEKSIMIGFLMSFGVGIIYSLIEALGEEIGWRGFLMPRLAKEMSMPAVIIVSGTIWGLWHAPIVYQGHTFGLKYKGAPWGGIVLMCLFCIFIGAWFYYLYVRSGSILVCALAHGFHNIVWSNFALFGVEGKNAEAMLEQLKINCMLLVPAMLLGGWAFWRLWGRNTESGEN